MSSPQDQIDAVLAELSTHRQRSQDLQAELMRRRVTVRSANRLVSVSVDARGSVLGVVFHSTAYTRMTPDELGRVITETTAEAQTEMARGVAEKLAPLRGMGRAVRESMTGGSAGPERQDDHG